MSIFSKHWRGITEKLKARFNKPFIVLPVVAFLIVALVFVALFTWKPTLFKGVFGMKIADKTSNSSESSLETKTDATQNQNSSESDKSNLGTTETLKTTTPTSTVSSPTNNQTSPTASEVITPPVSTNPTPEGSWTNSHGTFAYSNLGNIIPMFLGKDTTFTVGWSTGSCSSGTKFTIPTGTKIYKNYSQVPNYIDYYHNGSYPNPKTPGNYIYDLRGKNICNFDYYEELLSSSPSSIYYPGTLEIYW
jgi:hypothetical protein